MVTRRQFGACSAVAFALALKFAPQARAQESDQSTSENDIVVTASRIETSERDVASSMTIVDSDQIESGQYHNVTEALESVPGLDIVQSGGVGGNSAVFLRGANSEHTLVLFDGIELNNPASTNRAFDFSGLTLEGIEKIEVIRGPQSTIYGSDALGGVINIIPKRAAEGAHVSASTEAGSYDSYTHVGTIGYGSKAIDFTAGVTRQDVGGISASNASLGNSEQDEFSNTSLTSRLGFFPAEFAKVSFLTRYFDSGADIDNAGGVGADDPNRRLRREEFFNRAAVETSQLGGDLTQQVAVSYSHHDITDNNDTDEAHPTDILRSGFTGDLLKVDGHNTWKIVEGLTAVVGGETENERASSEYFSDGSFGPFEDNLSGRSARNNAVYVEGQGVISEIAAIDAGIRVDNQSEFGRKTTFRIAPAIFVADSTKLRGSVGTGFKAPSLVQLYSSFGNPDLEAEKSVGWDVGIDQEVGKLLTVSGTFFHNSFENLITFNPQSFVLENIADSNTRGFEFSAEAKPRDDVQLRASYTYTDSEDEATGLALLRRPRNKASLTASVEPVEPLTVQIQWRVYGSRADNDFSNFEPSRVNLGGYGLVDLNVSYELNDSIDLFSRIENLFDREYEDVLGYGTYGAAAYGGVRVRL